VSKKEEAPKISELQVQEETASGKVTAIGEPIPIQTQFGLTWRVPITVEVNGKPIECSVFVRDKTIKRGVIHPRSNLYKMLTRYGAKCLAELKGKRVDLRIDQRGFYKIVA